MPNHSWTFFVWSAKPKLQFNLLQLHLIQDGGDKFFTTCLSNFMYINTPKVTEYHSKSATQTIKNYKYFRVDYTKITVQKENILTNLKFWLRVSSSVLSFFFFLMRSFFYINKIYFYFKYYCCICAQPCSHFSEFTYIGYMNPICLRHIGLW